MSVWGRQCASLIGTSSMPLWTSITSCQNAMVKDRKREEVNPWSPCQTNESLVIKTSPEALRPEENPIDTLLQPKSLHLSIWLRRQKDWVGWTPAMLFAALQPAQRISSLIICCANCIAVDALIFAPNFTALPFRTQREWWEREQKYNREMRGLGKLTFFGWKRAAHTVSYGDTSMLTWRSSVAKTVLKKLEEPLFEGMSRMNEGSHQGGLIMEEYSWSHGGACSMYLRSWTAVVHGRCS